MRRRGDFCLFLTILTFLCFSWCYCRDPAVRIEACKHQYFPNIMILLDVLKSFLSSSLGCCHLVTHLDYCEVSDYHSLGRRHLPPHYYSSITHLPLTSVCFYQLGVKEKVKVRRGGERESKQARASTGYLTHSASLSKYSSRAGPGLSQELECIWISCVGGRNPLSSDSQVHQKVPGL